MTIPQPRTARRAAALMAAVGSLLVAGCGDDAEPSGTTPDTLADEEVIDQAPGVSNDVSNGSGEGGNPGDAPTGTAAP